MCFLRCFIVIVLASAGSVFSAPVARVQTYFSEQYRYRLSVPGSWHLSVAPNGVPTIYNYDPGLSLGQGLIPSGGAEIYLLPFAALGRQAQNERSWISEDVRSLAHGEAVIESVLNVKSASVTDVVRVSFDHERIPNEEPQRNVCLYFSLGGKLFKLGLSYWKGDPRGPSYELALMTILRSVRRGVGT